MQIKTINVVEYQDDELLRVSSFTNDDEGHKEARNIFSEIARAQGALTEELDMFIDESYYEAGTYQLFIKTSEHSA